MRTLLASVVLCAICSSSALGQIVGQGPPPDPPYIWVLHNGNIDEHICVLHKCDNPPCVNPDHLFLGTVLDNNADMVSKARQQRGEAHYQAILTEDQVRSIKSNYRRYSRTNSCNALARKYGVTPKTINAIINGENWKHVEV
jgi:hypothetical protein